MITKQGTLTVAAPVLIYESAVFQPGLFSSIPTKIIGLNLFNSDEVNPATIKLHIVSYESVPSDTTIYTALTVDPFTSVPRVFTPPLELPFGRWRIYLEPTAECSVNYFFDE